MAIVMFVLPVAGVLYVLNAFSKKPSAGRVDELERRLDRRFEEIEDREHRDE